MATGIYSMNSMPGRQNGIALFVTMVMVTIMLLIMVSIAYQEQLDFKRSSQMLISDQVVLLALSGESWAKKLLKDDEKDVDSLGDDWAQAIPVMPVEGGLLTGCIRDLNSRFNLNNFGYLGRPNSEAFADALNEPTSSHVDTYLNLLALLELDSSDERAARIVDWIDADDEPVAPGGAEDLDYSIEDPPRMAANFGLTDLSELVSIYGYSSADLLALKPYVSVMSSETAINVNTASRTLMLALMVNLDEYLVDTVIEGRPYETVEDFYERIAEESGYLEAAEVKSDYLPEALITVWSDYFELNAQVSMAGINMGLTSIFYRGQSSDDIQTISRTFTYIPQLSIEEGQVDPLVSPCYVAPSEDEAVL